MLAPPFTPELARKLQSYSVEARRRNKIEKEMANAIVPIDPANKSQVAWLRSEMDRIGRLMSKETDAKQLAFFASAHAKLFAAWQVLTGTANPGSRKTKAGPANRQIPAARDAWEATNVARPVATEMTTQAYVIQETKQNP